MLGNSKYMVAGSGKGGSNAAADTAGGSGNKNCFHRESLSVVEYFYTNWIIYCLLYHKNAKMEEYAWGEMPNFDGNIARIPAKWGGKSGKNGKFGSVYAI